jgi:hypothetical protein
VQNQRLKERRGRKRALGAVKHSLLSAIWHMLSTGETYRDLRADYFTQRDPERQTRRLLAQRERRGSLNELSLSVSPMGSAASPGFAAVDHPLEKRAEPEFEFVDVLGKYRKRGLLSQVSPRPPRRIQRLRWSLLRRVRG